MQLVLQACETKGVGTCCCCCVNTAAATEVVSGNSNRADGRGPGDSTRSCAGDSLTMELGFCFAAGAGASAATEDSVLPVPTLGDGDPEFAMADAATAFWALWAKKSAFP
ncbi:hypothetical protein K437DRAFT_54021 [Tilletiaria anomala UBC 951]|uniref:Uncharacterized protein n=1 Tax=Tilletiaria anomala (strain ATCC 24038 / CBS 436.72 / UBC 951) TaxID=1037660 RepID=A0A066V444_TILAU|nr:uncharacterized protein K437DRAFT_54021 [Tilletiaria anomala UBC 951]KDN36482.1 hypothetical protein K437DRAFT_54021 [Tilletiaria anomala UBC 951]